MSGAEEGNSRVTHSFKLRGIGKLVQTSANNFLPCGLMCLSGSFFESTYRRLFLPYRLAPGSSFGRVDCVSPR